MGDCILGGMGLHSRIVINFKKAVTIMLGDKIIILQVNNLCPVTSIHP